MYAYVHINKYKLNNCENILQNRLKTVDKFCKMCYNDNVVKDKTTKFKIKEKMRW